MDEWQLEPEINEIYLDDLLYRIVEEANRKVNGDGCSIFLLEEGTNRYVLRESTVLTQFLGIYSLEVGKEEKVGDRVGVTKVAIIRKGPGRYNDLRHERWWSNWGLGDEELKKKPRGHCELSHDEVGPFLVIPLIDRDKVIGVIRVVRSRKTNKGPFTDKDEAELKRFIDKHLKRIVGSRSLSRLIEMGSMLDLRQLCEQVVDTLAKMFKAKGCSIFLLDGEKEDGTEVYRCFGTTGLYYGKHPQFKEIQNPYEEAVYTYKSGDKIDSLTVAVINKRENLIIKDLQNYDPRKELEIDRRPGPGYYSEKYFKDRQLVPTGAVIYAPLLFPDRPDVDSECLGVIRISKPAGESFFESPHTRLFLSFAQKLSKTIINSKFISILSEPFSESEPKKFFKKILKCASQFVGGHGCSLFMLHDDVLELYSTHGNLEDKTIEPYGLGEGYTGWVGLYKKTLMFNDTQDLDKYEDNIPRPTHSGRNLCETKDAPPDKFLAVPILNSKHELLGVLRTAKTLTDPPFTGTDLMIFRSLAGRLSPIIEHINIVKKLTDSEAEEMEKMFSKSLIQCCTNLKSSIFKENIKNFFEPKQPLDEKTLAVRIFDLVTSLWNETKVLFGSIDMLRVFEFFNKRFLEELPGYRDHFIHQFQVFLLGSHIIDELDRLGIPFHEAYFESLKLSKLLPDHEKRRELAETAWLITSTFHDIAYPLTELDTWLTRVVHTYLGLDPVKERMVSGIPFEKIFLYDKKKNYLDYTERLTNFLQETELIPQVSVTDFRKWIQYQVALDKDHGVLGSLILVSTNSLYLKEIIYPSALSIALHKNLGPKVAVAAKEVFSYKKFPLFFLLIFCDLVQEWSRNGGTVALDKICVTDKINEVPDISDHVPEQIKEIKNTVFVVVKVIMGKADEKIKECKRWFNVIKSRNPCFCLFINDEFFGSW